MGIGLIVAPVTTAWRKIRKNHGFPLIGGWLSVFGPAPTARRLTPGESGHGSGAMRF
jgi:hypothetical protein